MLQSDCQSNPTPNGDWLYFSHVKKAIRDADWTYRFLHMISTNLEFYLLRLLHKILSIYVIKNSTKRFRKYQNSGPTNQQNEP